jgi:transposase, IS5 family
MRQSFNPQPGLQITPIEKIILPLHSRDELPPILAGLQWMWMHPSLKAQVLALLEARVLAGKKRTGRTGMDLWQILVLGVVRLGLNADWDRMEHLANYDLLLRQMLGLCPNPWGTNARRFGHQTLRDNVALVDGPLLKEINILVAVAGRQVFVCKPSVAPPPLQIKVDTYVLETDVHFPTDLNLLFDAGRKCLDLVEKYQKVYGYELPGWRKLEDWRRRFKSAERVASKTAFGGGKDKDKRVQAVVSEYLQTGRELSAKIQASLLSLCDQAVDEADWERLAYFQQMLDKHVDLVDRRLLQRQVIPTAEKLYSLFEPHTEWLTKGKLHPPVELGHRLLVATDQHQLIQDYDGPVGADVDQSVPVASRLIGRHGEGQLASISFDKGFTRREDRELLEMFIPQVIMPKRGRKNAEEAEAESAKKFVALRKTHSAVESAINALEHHGLNRCLDVGLEGYARYIGYGVLAYNLHVIGRQLLAQRCAADAALASAA